MSAYNVISVSFNADDNAYAALAARQREAQRQATRELLRGRRERTEEKIRTKVDELTGKLSRRETAPGA